jgi:lipopolysaccharide/colanic/teichoic acid biosynthesis glycosyltransferase
MTYMSLENAMSAGPSDLARLFSAHSASSQGSLTHHLPSAWTAFGKRAFDLSAAASAFLLLLPLLVVLAVAVRLAMGRGVFYRQTRVGRNGRHFAIIKFRTMKHERREDQSLWAGPERRLQHKSPDDPRHTPVGRVLRRWSLDELPQLWNILVGHMSLVGPRPELADIVETYEDWEHDRHLVRPGLTGLWQVTARGNGTQMRDHTRLDIHYARSVSLRTDATILLRTFAVVGNGH